MSAVFKGSVLLLVISSLAKAAPEDREEILRLQKEIAEIKAHIAKKETEVRKEDVQGVQSDLENFKFQVQRERERTALPTRPLTISGIVQVRSSYSDRATDTAAVEDRKSNFEVGTAILGFRGSLYRDYEEGRNLNYTLSTAASGNGTGTFSILDANISYSVLSSNNLEEPKLLITWGQQQLPFGLEVQASEELKPVISGAQFASRFDLGSRQNGIIIRGDLSPSVDYGYNFRVPLVEYALGVVNGNGPNVADNNEAKDVVGRLALAVPTDYNSFLRQITIGFSALRGQQNQVIANNIVGLGLRQRTGIDFSYNHHPVGITYEYVQGLDEIRAGTDPAVTTESRRRALGQTATFFYNFGEQFVKGYRAQGRYDDWWPLSIQPFYRYDTFVADLDKKDEEDQIQTLGLNIFFAETSKIQFNLTRNDKVSTARYHDFVIQGQFGF